MNNSVKPLMKISIDPHAHTYFQSKKLGQTLAKHFSDRYDILYEAQGSNVHVSTENMLTIVVSSDTDIEKFVEKLENYMATK